MFELILLSFLVYVSAFYCLKSSKQVIKVEPIQSFDDYFIESFVKKTFTINKPQ
ncbi:hypothetical protein ACN6MT_24355 [Neobacillus niacini]|uniref:hypothetical protein n=1 Tax=Neobacillus niacini TaxID=86668 RepID=UPI003B020B4B